MKFWMKKNYEWTEIVGLKIIYKIEEQQHTHTQNPAELTELLSC